MILTAISIIALVYMMTTMKSIVVNGGHISTVVTIMTNILIQGLCILQCLFTFRHLKQTREFGVKDQSINI